VDWKNVKVEQAPTNPKIYELGTGGSGSVAGSWLPLRRAGAAAREMLIAAAAQKWEVGADTCKAVDGQVVHGNPKRYLSYGELVEAAAKLPIPNFNTVPLKNSDNFTLVGHDTPRYEAPRKGQRPLRCLGSIRASRDAVCGGGAVPGCVRREIGFV